MFGLASPDEGETLYVTDQVSGYTPHCNQLHSASDELCVELGVECRVLGCAGC